MKRSLLLAVIVVFAASQAFAFGGSIGLFASPAGASCALLQGPVTQPTMLHIDSDGTTGSQYQALVPTCAGLVHLADLLNFAVSVGNTQQGLSVGYGACDNTGSVNIGSMFTQMTVPTTGCCTWSVGLHPGFPDPTAVSTTCATPIGEEPAAGGSAILSVNTGVCPCNIANQESTWAR